MEEGDLWRHNFYAVLAAVSEGSRRVDGGVFVDGAVADTSFFGELEDDVGVFAAGVGDFYGLVAYGGLDETDSAGDFALEGLGNWGG